MVSTVSIPKPLKPLFEAAEQHVSRYFEQREFHPDQGTIDIFGARYILLRGPSISVEFFQLCRKLFGPAETQVADLFAAGLLYELAHAIGQSDARAFHQKMNLKGPVEKLSAGPVHFAHAGWAFVEILPESQPTPDENFFMAYKHPYSFESSAWQESELTPSQPVCVMSAGYSGGWCEESFGISLEARELTCRALGHRDCHFVMTQPEQIDERVSSYLNQHPELAPEHDTSHSHHSYLDTQKILDEGHEQSFNHLLSHHLFTYARNLETTRHSLAEKITQLNAEIDAREQADRRLSKSEKRWRELSDVLFDSIMICSDQQISYANAASETLFGINPAEIAGKNPAELLGEKNWQLLHALKNNAERKSVELEILTDTRSLIVEAQCYLGADNELILALRDASERVRARHKLEHLANYDILTELPNRNTIERIISRQIDNAKPGDTHALLFLDLDDFKQANDQFGHKVGDLALQAVTNRAHKAIRAGDVLSRVGGDEFLVWLPYMADPIDVETTAQRILQTLHKPLDIQGNKIGVTFSIGIAMFPKNGGDFSTLYLHADRAMYQAKDSGRNTYRFYREPSADTDILTNRDDSGI